MAAHHPDNHFWYDLGKGKSINASEGSSYHIQHVVRNPTKFGLTQDEMKEKAKFDLSDIESGYRDIDHDLEHHVMSKGFVRGYAGTPVKDDWGDRRGYIDFDAATEDHAKQALTHFLPHIQKAEKEGSGYEVSMNIGHKGNWNNVQSRAFLTAKEIQEYIGTGAAPKPEAPKAEKKEEPRSAPAGFGQMSTVKQVNLQKGLQAAGTPRWQAYAQSGMTSESYKTFKQCFREEISKLKSTENPEEKPAGSDKSTIEKVRHQKRLQSAGTPKWKPPRSIDDFIAAEMDEPIRIR